MNLALGIFFFLLWVGVVVFVFSHFKESKTVTVTSIDHPLPFDAQPTKAEEKFVLFFHRGLARLPGSYRPAVIVKTGRKSFAKYKTTHGGWRLAKVVSIEGGYVFLSRSGTVFARSLLAS